MPGDGRTRRRFDEDCEGLACLGPPRRTDLRPPNLYRTRAALQLLRVQAHQRATERLGQRHEDRVTPANPVGCRDVGCDAPERLVYVDQGDDSAVPKDFDGLLRGRPQS